MFIWKRLFRLASALLGSTVLLSACVGAAEVNPLPAAGPSAIPSGDMLEEIEPDPTSISAEETDPLPAPEPTAISADDLPEEIDVAPTRIPVDQYADLEIVTLLPRDAIPAIDNPQFLSVAEADEFYDLDELVIGVEFDGDARAYSIPFLSNREIVNDTVGGVKIAVTW